MKRAVADLEPARAAVNKRVRTAFDDVDSAYVSLGSITPITAGSPMTIACDAQEDSVTSTSRRPKVYSCTYDSCDKSFDRPARLEIHIRSHTKERPFVCEQFDCGKTFLRSEHLKAHLKSKHADSRDYACSYQTGIDANGEPIICGKSFHTGTRLRRHIAAHEDKEQTKCQECGQIFRKQETLQRHIRSEHLKEDAYRCAHLVIGDGETEEQCGQSFPTVGQLKAHEAREHSGLRYFCHQCQHGEDDCGMTDRVGFNTYSELQLHMKTVHPPSCGICGHVAPSNRGLRAHMEIVHSSLSERQRFACTYAGCDRKFTKHGNLKVHIQTVHANIKAYRCGESDLSSSKNVEGWSGLGCGTSFGTKASLEQHIRTQHLGLPPTITSKVVRKHNGATGNAHHMTGSAGASTSITGHGYVESRPFACIENECESRFQREHDLVMHLELHHSWHIDDINEVLAGETTMQDDQFWIGGLDPVHQATADNAVHDQDRMDMSSVAAASPRLDLMEVDPQLL